MVFAVFANPIVQSFASRPFIQHALQNVYQPVSVLNFWFGVDIATDIGKDLIRKGANECLSGMASLWYGGGPDFDTLCQPFADTVHLAGTCSLPNIALNGKTNAWYTTVDGNVAQVILIDQLARNIFRGTENAFKYDHVSLSIARQLSTQYLLQQEAKQATAVATTSVTNVALQQQESVPLITFNNILEDLSPPYITVLATSLMHSEQQLDHQLCVTLIEHTICLSKLEDESEEASSPVCKWFESQLKFAIDHKKVIDQFGRYPHRNRILNRTCTPEESEWLSDSDNLPGWAKSQS
jgi:uncharacterized protein (DUF924 family)